MISNAKSDTRRAIRPLPGGQRPTRTEGLSTLLKLTDVTGLTTKGDGAFNRTIERDNAWLGLTRVFAALPGVNAKRDFVAPYNALAARRSSAVAVP